MKKLLLVGGCVVGGILCSKMIKKCVNKLVENKPDDVKKEVKNTVEKALVVTAGIAVTYSLASIVESIDSRINAVNNNTELCCLAIILNSENTNAEKIEILEAVKEKFTSPKVLEKVCESITELMGGE